MSTVQKALPKPFSSIRDFERRQPSVDEARREIGKHVQPTPDFSPPAGGRENRHQILAAETILAGIAIGRRELQCFAYQIAAVRLQHDHLVGALRHGADDIGRRLLDVMQYADQERGVVARQRVVIEGHEVNGPIGRLMSQLGVGALDGCFRFVDAVDLPVAAGQHLIGKGAVAAAEIEHMAIRRNAQQACDINGDLPHPATDMRFDVGTSIHGLAIALLARAIPVAIRFAVGLIAGHGPPLRNPCRHNPIVAFGRAGIACQEIPRLPTAVLFRR